MGFEGTITVLTLVRSRWTVHSTKVGSMSLNHVIFDICGEKHLSTVVTLSIYKKKIGKMYTGLSINKRAFL